MKPGTHTLSNGHNRLTAIKSDGAGAKLIQNNRGVRTEIYLDPEALNSLREVLR